MGNLILDLGSFLTLIRLSLVLVSDLNSRWSLQKIRDGEIRSFKQISAVNGGVKLSNYGGIKLSIYLKSFP